MHVRARLDPLADSGQEVLELDTKRLVRSQPRCEHIARAVGELELAEALRLHDLDAAVEHAHLLGVRVLVHDHLLRPDQHGAAQLGGREPGELEMDERAVVVADIHEGDVERARDDRVARDAAHERGPAQPVEEDREVVRREVAHDADVALVDAEVDPARRAEIELADLPAFQPFLRCDDRRRVEECVTGHQDEIPLGRDLDQLVALLDGRSHRLLHEDVLAREQSCLAHFVVGRDRRDDADRIDVVVGQDVVEVRDELALPVAASLTRERVLVAVADDADA